MERPTSFKWETSRAHCESYIMMCAVYPHAAILLPLAFPLSSPLANHLCLLSLTHFGTGVGATVKVCLYTVRWGDHTGEDKRRPIACLAETLEKKLGWLTVFKEEAEPTRPIFKRPIFKSPINVRTKIQRLGQLSTGCWGQDSSIVSWQFLGSCFKFIFCIVFDECFLDVGVDGFGNEYFEISLRCFPLSKCN